MSMLPHDWEVHNDTDHWAPFLDATVCGGLPSQGLLEGPASAAVGCSFIVQFL
jgi:hypothetical protein